MHFGFTFRRDCVSQGDDAINPNPHFSADIDEDTKLSSLLELISEKAFLPSISGGEATWIIQNTQPLAVMAQQWEKPKFLVSPDTPFSILREGGAYIRCVYWCQKDPNQVFECLLHHQPLPRRYK